MENDASSVSRFSHSTPKVNDEKQSIENDAPRPRHRIRSHLAMFDLGGNCYAPGCPACRWYRARGGWSADDSWTEWANAR